MSRNRTVIVDLEGKAASVRVTELAPGRWSWSLRVEGEAPLASALPFATSQLAMSEVMSIVRARARGEDPVAAGIQGTRQPSQPSARH